MVLLIRDPLFQEHHVPPGHPECPERLVAIDQAFDRAFECGGLDRSMIKEERSCHASSKTLQLIHPAAYIDRIKDFCMAGGGALDSDTYVSEASWDVACHAAGSAVRAVEFVLGGEGRCAFCALRPPGHHAGRNEAKGFCLFNNIAMAAASALRHPGIRRVLIVDWDLHHGNGTEDIFIEDSNVFYFSMHCAPFFPGTGSASQTGRGVGEGYTLNLPLAPGTPRQAIREGFSRSMGVLSARFKPDLLLISSGFDMHGMDPMSPLSLCAEDYGQMTHELARIFMTNGARGIVSCLEGGYHHEATAASALAHVKALVEIASQAC